MALGNLMYFVYEPRGTSSMVRAQFLEMATYKNSRLVKKVHCDLDTTAPWNRIEISTSH